MAWLGAAGHGAARHGAAWQGPARLGRAWQGMGSMNIRREMRAFADAHDTRTPEQLGQMFVRAHHAEDLVPLVIDEFKAIERGKVRAAEIDLLRGMVNPMPARTLESVQAALGDLATLLDEPYRIGDGTARRLGSLTEAEHQERLSMLRANVAGLERDIELHEHALHVIRSHGISCLDDLAERQPIAA